MYIYRGKLDFSPTRSDLQNATNEGITTIFPSGVRLGDPVYTCWQWSTLGKFKNVPCWLAGVIDSVYNSGADGNRIGFYGGDYRFDGFLSGSKYTEDFSLMVRSGDVVGTAMNTKLVFTDRSDSGPTTHPNAIVPRIYLGKLANYAPYSIDQTLLVVLPGRTVCEGNPICAFWQWTVDRHGSTKVNVDHTTSKMTNLEKVTDYVSFTDGSGYFTFHATVGLREFAEQQQLSLVITNRDPSFSTGSLVLELQDLRPSPSGRQPRGVNDNTTMVINDANKAPSGFQNAGPFLIRSPSPKIVELTNKPSEPAIRDRLDRDGMSAQLETKLQVAQLESQLRAEQDENKLLKTMLLEAERAREKDGLTAKDKVRGGAKWKCLIPSR